MHARLFLVLAGLLSSPVPRNSPPTPALPPDVCEEPAAGPYNILMIVLDDVGTDKLAVYGETEGSNAGPPCNPASTCYPVPCEEPYPYAPTPSLDALAGCGILFTSYYVNPLCSTTRAAMMTGRYAFRTGMGGLVGPTSRVDDGEVFIPELLKLGFTPSSPYQCGAFGKWHLTHPSGNETHPVDNGFDFFAGPMGNNGDHFDWDKVTATSSGTSTDPQSAFDASVTSADALAWINGLDSSQRFFAYVSFNAPHFPYQVPPFDLLSLETQDYLTCTQPWGGPFVEGQVASASSVHEQRVFYRAMLEAVDTEIGNLIEGIEAEQKEKTVIIVVSDNGTPRAIIDPSEHPIGHGKSTVYQIGVRVPMIVAGPIVEQEDRGEVCTRLVGAVDLWRTIRDVAGASEATLEAAIGPLAEHDGVSFATLIADPSSSAVRELAFSQTFNANFAYDPTPYGPYELGCPPQWFPPSNSPLLWCCDRVIFNGGHARSITDGSYKLIRKLLTNGVDGGLDPGNPSACLADTPPTYKDELYDIASDPAEQTDLHSDTTPLSIETTLAAALEALSGK